MACLECEKERLRKETERKAAGGGGNTPPISSPQNACGKAKSYVSLAMSRQQQYWNNNKKFGTPNDIALGQSPNPNEYSYSFVAINTYFTSFKATPHNDSFPVVIGYAYVMQQGNVQVCYTITQISYKQKSSSLITQDAPQSRQLTLEQGYQYNC